MGLRNVTFSCIGPAWTVRIVHVGVTAVASQMLAFPIGWPSQWYAIPSTLMYPAQPSICVARSASARAQIFDQNDGRRGRGRRTCWSFQNCGHVDIGFDPFRVSSQQLNVGVSTARGTAEGKNVCCARAGAIQLLQNWRIPSDMRVRRQSIVPVERKPECRRGSEREPGRSAIS
jgi:hypothetical protein